MGIVNQAISLKFIITIMVMVPLRILMQDCMVLEWEIMHGEIMIMTAIQIFSQAEPEIIAVLLIFIIITEIIRLLIRALVFQPGFIVPHGEITIMMVA